MLVSRDDLAIAPVVDRALAAIAGEIVNEVEVEGIGWSNELAAHVLELKNTEPSGSLAPLSDLFSAHVVRMNRLLEPSGTRLMPGAMHPFLRPREEARLWPHEGREIYQAFDRIFDCRRHGWVNVQSAQLNVSFGSDEDFARLHAAARVLLPILPALAASSPVLEGEVTPLASTRLEVYRTLCQKLPSVAGHVIPEPIFGRREYENTIYEAMYRELEAHDPEGTLRHPWLNARGAIPKFDRGALEIRILDAQECPAADVAIAAATVAVLKAMVAERFTDSSQQRGWRTEPLSEILLATIRDAESTVLRDPRYLALFGYPDRDGTAKDLWLYLVESLAGAEGLDSSHLGVILEEGPLARRIVRALGKNPSREDIASVYRRLCECLDAGQSFTDH
jgi:gamma-glutamyl:cysteine ligase YbdK (ATP-grasp superfamily)